MKILQNPLIFLKVMACFLLFINSFHTQAQQTEERTNGNIGFLSYLPPTYTTNNDDHPLLVFLHGIGERGDNLDLVARNGIPKLIRYGKWPDERPFIVISPQLPSGLSWSANIVDDIIEYIKANYRVDENRIYLTGLSWGGMGAWRYAMAHPEKIAAVVPIAGNGNTSTACNMKDVPTWAFHGDADNIVNVNGSISMVNVINACSPAPKTPAKLTIYPGVTHNSWSRTYDLSAGHDIYTWMLSHKKGNKNKNQSPSVNADPDKTITLPVNSLTLNGSANDPDGNITTYQWTKTSGPAASLINTDKATMQLNDLVEGIYMFQLTVTDDQNATAQDQVKVTVNPPANIAPIANAGPDQNIALPQNSLSLKGSASDPDGNITGYQWSKENGPAASLNNANQTTLQIKDLVEGTYTFKLKVTDNQNATAYDQVKVTVSPAANQAPVADAGPDKSVTFPENSISLNGSANDTDGNITSYQWSKASGPAANLVDAHKATLQLKDLVEGAYVFRLTVTDDQNATAYDQVKVTVSPAANQAPVADAGPDKSVTFPENSLKLNGSASDPDGNIISYQWSKTSGPTASLMDANKATLQLKYLVEGAYVFRLMVTDNNNATAYDQVKITVNAAANQAPTANAGQDQSTTLSQNSLKLNGSANDPDGNITSYQWSKASGPAANLIDANKATVLLKNLVEGSYVFKLMVTDNQNATAYDKVNVIVYSAANQAPVVKAGPDQTIILPKNSVVISGSAQDPDGNIEKYSWTKVSGPFANLTGTAKAELKASNLEQGTYVFRLTAIDNDNASSFDEVKIFVKSQQQRPLIAKITSSDVACNGHNDGKAKVIVSGGVEPYEYIWSNGTKSGKVENLQAGAYTVKVTDKNGETVSASVNIREPALITIDADITHETDKNRNGSIKLDIKGGVSPYKIEWSVNGEESTDIRHLASGDYTVKVTDQNNCTVTGSFTIDNVNTGKILGFVLVNAETNAEIASLTDGDVINLETLETTKLNIKAMTEGKIENIKFTLNKNFTNIQHEAPYLVFGKDGNHYKIWSPKPGKYQLAAIPHSKGNQRERFTINFRVAEEQEHPAAASKLNFYPNPFENYINVEYPVSKPTMVNIRVFDQFGVYFEHKVSALPNNNKINIDLSGSSFISGEFYFLQIHSAEKGTEILKVFKR